MCRYLLFYTCSLIQKQIKDIFGDTIYTYTIQINFQQFQLKTTNTQRRKYTMTREQSKTKPNQIRSQIGRVTAEQRMRWCRCNRQSQSNSRTKSQVAAMQSRYCVTIKCILQAYKKDVGGKCRKVNNTDKRGTARRIQQTIQIVT